jgi:hypothetical protein
MLTTVLTCYPFQMVVVKVLLSVDETQNLREVFGTVTTMTLLLTLLREPLLREHSLFQ